MEKKRKERKKRQNTKYVLLRPNAQDEADVVVSKDTLRSGTRVLCFILIKSFLGRVFCVVLKISLYI